MAKCLLVLAIFCTVATSGFADSWTPPEPIPNSFSAHENVFTAYDPNTNQYIATWADGSRNPMYAIYDVQTKSWSTPMPIPGSSTVFQDVFISCDPITGLFMATWELSSSPYIPTYSTFTTAMGWTLPAPIYASASAQSNIVFNAVDPSSGQFMAIWGDEKTTDKILYSIYDESSQTWSVTPGTLPTSSFATTPFPQDDSDVYVTFGAGHFMATWADFYNSSYPFYAIYTTGSWSTPTDITTSSSAINDVTTSFDPITSQFMATWTDNTFNYPTYAIYTAGPGWSSSAAMTSTSTAEYDVFTSFNSFTGQFMATWSDAGVPSSSHTPAYSLYTVNTGEWSPPAPISTTANTSSFDVPNSFGSVNGQFMATWNDQITFSLYPAQFSPPAPSGFAGKQRQNDFAIVCERYNVLSWQKAAGVSYYELFRNGELIATLGGDADSYEDHDQPKHNVTYSLVAFNASGGSNPAMVTVGRK